MRPHQLMLYPGVQANACDITGTCKSRRLLFHMMTVPCKRSEVLDSLDLGHSQYRCANKAANSAKFTCVKLVCGTFRSVACWNLWCLVSGGDVVGRCHAQAKTHIEAASSVTTSMCAARNIDNSQIALIAVPGS